MERDYENFTPNTNSQVELHGKKVDSPCRSLYLIQTCTFHNILSITEFFLHARRQNIIFITKIHHLHIFIIFIGRKSFTFSCRPDFSFIFIHTTIHIVKSIIIFKNETQLFKILSLWVKCVCVYIGWQIRLRYICRKFNFCVSSWSSLVFLHSLLRSCHLSDTFLIISVALLSCTPSLPSGSKRFAQIVSWAEGLHEVPACHISSYKGLSGQLSDAFLYGDEYNIGLMHTTTEITRSWAQVGLNLSSILCAGLHDHVK